MSIRLSRPVLFNLSIQKFNSNNKQEKKHKRENIRRRLNIHLRPPLLKYVSLLLLESIEKLSDGIHIWKFVFIELTRH